MNADDFVAAATCFVNPNGTPATVLDVTVLVCGLSRSAARRLITSGGVYVNNVRMTDPDLAWAWIP